MSQPDVHSKLVSDVAIVPLLDFLISETAEYKDLAAMCNAFNAALDALNKSSFCGESFGIYINAVEQKMQDMTEEYYARKKLYVSA
jgi:hypothetical protein